jgi:ABC-2 type transport system permease protein
MRAMVALIKRELLEHKAAFLYAPAALLGVLTLVVLFGLFNRAPEFPGSGEGMTGSILVYQVALAGAFGGWSIYTGLGLFFYYADAFSADRRNNALLFWKSMPQSDLKVLTSKALAGITVFPALFVGYAVLTGIVIYVLGRIASLRFPVIQAPNPGEALLTLVQMSAVGIIYIVLSILWSAPFLAWVAGLSTLFRRWSIPLALLIPGAVVFLEFINTIGRPGATRPIAEFLAWRFDSIADPRAVFGALIGDQAGGPWRMLTVILQSVNWLHMGIGIVTAIVIVTLASEYRRRRIEA